jgi:hypothetical protein
MLKLFLQFSYNSLFFLTISLSLELLMRPDYPYKIFTDKRNVYSLLMQTLAEDSIPRVA